MSDKMRWRYGDTNPVVAAVDSATVIEIGDIVLQDVDSAYPASTHSHVVQQFRRTDFKERFLGVAMQNSRAGDTAPIKVATTGVFEFDCRESMFELGNLIGPDQHGPGLALLNQQVTQVATAADAIGRVTKREPVPCYSVLVDVRSTVMTGGV